MNVTVCIATYGEDHWVDLALSRALPSIENADCEFLLGHQKEGTIASTRNALADEASTDWLCFLDADDELGPGYVEAMKRAYEQERGDGPLLLTPAVSYVRKGRPSPAKFMDRGISLRDDNWLVVGTLIQKDLFMQVGGFGEYPHGFEDWSLWAKCWKAGARIVKVKNAIYLAHVNPQSKHRQGWRDKRWQVQTHQRVRKELFPELS